uniref:Peptidase A1 domain-containing protein n=1 Tax=Kalanchoe fedtschenkoi TaxID=63787 RepID=A0A7N0T645_KALFE
MAITNLQLSVVFLLAILSIAHSQPRNIFLPVTKDQSTLQYVTQIKLGTPPVSRSLVVDLGGRGPWIDCDQIYKSSTYKPVLCGSEVCSFSKIQFCFVCYAAQRPGCNNTRICDITPINTVTDNFFVPAGELATDKVSVKTFSGARSGPDVILPRLILSCAPNALLEGLAAGTTGMAYLDGSPNGLPNQFSSAIGSRLPRIFALCLPSTPNKRGAILFGSPPYIFHTNVNKSNQQDLSTELTYTRLIINPDSPESFQRGVRSTEYYVSLKSILVNKMPVSINSTLLTLASGGTKISTAKPYTVLETSIYKSLASAFSKHMAAMKITKVAPVAPFTECFSTDNLAYTALGPDVPVIGLTFEDGAAWEMYGYNSMAEVSKRALCLAFVDGGSAMGTKLVIGGRQLEDVLLQFDLRALRLGFTRSLIWGDHACENFAA